MVVVCCNKQDTLYCFCQQLVVPYIKKLVIQTDVLRFYVETQHKQQQSQQFSFRYGGNYKNISFQLSKNVPVSLSTA